jgi:hypothetical protein
MANRPRNLFGMKIAYLLPALWFATFIASPTSAHADGINLAAYTGQTVLMTVEPYASGENNGSFYVGLTQVNLATLGGASIGSLEGFCDDFNHDITTPDTYSEVVTAVAGNTTMEEEAYYGLELGTKPSGNSALDTDLQELIWNFSSPGQFTLNSEMQTLQRQMQANYQNVDYSDSFYLNAGNGGQSFMTTDPSTVPEPVTLVMFGTGLLAAAGYAGMKTKRILNLDIKANEERGQ